MAWFRCKFREKPSTNFPMGQNDNGNLLNTSSIINYFNNTYAVSKGKKWFVAYNYTSGNYIYIKFYAFSDSSGSIYATINDDTFTPFEYGTADVKSGTGYYNPSNGRFYNMSSVGGLGTSFNNSVSSKSNTSKSYLSNYEITDGSNHKVLQYP